MKGRMIGFVSLQDMFDVFCEKFVSPKGSHWGITQRKVVGRNLYRLVLIDDATGEQLPALYSMNEYYMGEMKAVLEALCDSISNDHMRSILQATMDSYVAAINSDD